MTLNDKTSTDNNRLYSDEEIRAEIQSLLSDTPNPEAQPPPTEDAEPIDGFSILEFDSSADIIAYFDEGVNSGKVILHPWQVNISEELCQQNKPTSLEPLRYCLCAANGSGKDIYVIAPFAIWFMLTKIKSRVIITSSSGVQLSSQTETYIRNLAENINNHFGRKIFKINQRHIKCLISGSECRLFATDESSKAEGYHPLEPGAEMAIIVNEAKSVDEEIFKALTRCTGYNYWLNVSTPGEPVGHFYRSFNNWQHKRRVTAFDCPHLGESYILDARSNYGEHSALYRSMILALFTSIGGQVVIREELLNFCLANPPALKYQDWPIRIGIDLAAGGDECVIAYWKGNRYLGMESFIEKDTTISADILERSLRKHSITHDHKFIFADDGGVGRGIIDQLNRRGWNINRVLNQSAAIYTREFGNRGAELWFKFARLVEENLIIIPKDETKLHTQLTHRHYKKASAQGKMTLESKPEERSNGFDSPDRADATVLAFCDLTIENFLKEQSEDSKKLSRKKLTQEELIALMTESRFAEIEARYTKKGQRRYHADYIPSIDEVEEQFGISKPQGKRSKRSWGSLNVILNYTPGQF